MRTTTRIQRINVASLGSLASALGLAFGLGCAQPASSDPGTIEVTHDVCGSIVLGAPAANEDQLAAIDHAMALWHERGVLALVRATESPAIDIVFEKALPGIHGLYDDTESRVYINKGLVDPDPLAVVIAHELGHAFGLVHVTTRSSVMNPGNLQVTPTVEDQQALELLWGVCAPH